MIEKDYSLLVEVFENVSEGIILVDSQLKIIDVNQALHQITGIEKHFLLNKHLKFLSNHLKPSITEESLAALQTMEAGDKIKMPDAVWNHKTISVSISKSSSSDFAIVVKDISNHQQLLQEFKNSEYTYREILNSIEEAVYIQDEKGVFLDVNKAAERFYGYTRDELLGKTPAFVTAPEKNDLSKIEEKVIMAFNGTPQRFYFWGKRKDGVVFPKEVSVSPGNYKGKAAVIAVARNITERLAAEEKLKKSEALLNTIIENSQNGIFVINEKRQFTFVNKSLSRIFDMPEQDILYQDFAKFIAEDSLDIVKTRYYDRQSGKDVPSNYEFNIQRNDGSKRRVEIISVALTVNEKQKITVGQVMDVTNSKKISEELQEAKDQYYRLFQNVHDAVMVFDPQDETILNCNEQALKLYGFTRDEFIGMSLKKISKHPDKGEQKIAETMSNGEIKNFESTQYTKQGRELKLEVSARLIDYSNQPAILSLNHDITTRKKQDKIQQLLLDISEKSAKDITLREYIAIIHNELKKIIKADNLFIALYDKTTGKYSFPYYEDETDNFEGEEQIDLSNTLTNFIRKTKKGRLITEETEKKLKEKENIKLYGEPSPVWMGVPLMDSESEEVIGVLVLQDYHDKSTYSNDDLLTLEIISNHIGLFIERVKNMEQLKHAKEMAEKSDHLKSAFLANMSHEIRTPMNGIIGFTDLLLEPEFSGKQKTAFIEAIQKSGNRMLNTVNDIVEISKIETGEVQVRNKAFNLNQKIKEIIQFFIPEAKKKTIVLDFDTPLFDKDTDIFSDESKIESIITNLVKNAIKYSDEGQICFGYDYHQDHLLFYCKDEGIGIPENRRDAIFNRFEQADIADTRAFQGSGLGLAISKSYVEMLGGEIWVESKMGEGSTFYFKLPLKFVAGKPTVMDTFSTKTKDFPTNKKLHILIAEDDENAVQYLQIVLADIAETIQKVFTGKDAVAYCKAHPETDLVLMDIQLPHMDGHQATQEIRKFNKEVAIIAQTAYALEGDRQKALDNGCDDYIAKPLDREELLKIIANNTK